MARMLPLAGLRSGLARGSTLGIVMGLTVVRDDVLHGQAMVSVHVRTMAADPARYGVFSSPAGRANGMLVSLSALAPRLPIWAPASSSSGWTVAPAILFVTDRGYLIVVVPLSAGGFGVAPAITR